jgi:hypothetical protein
MFHILRGQASLVLAKPARWAGGGRKWTGERGGRVGMCRWPATRCDVGISGLCASAFKQLGPLCADRLVCLANTERIIQDILSKHGQERNCTRMHACPVYCPEGGWMDRWLRGILATAGRRSFL